MHSNQDFFRRMLLIRLFEEKLLNSFKLGVFFGTTHTAIGQEADAVGVLSCLSESDIVVSNHRGHGHFLAYGGDPESLFAELMGSPTGVCGGKGGSQHLHWQNFYSNGIQGGIVPMAIGMALAEKHKGSDAISVVFMGDGTLGEGVVYESLNMAALWQAPILFVLENNHIAQTTPIELALAGDISKRFDAFSVPNMRIDTSDILEIQSLAKDLIDKVRKQKSPQALIIDTIRFGAHSKGDDTRSEADMAVLRANRDPLTIHAQRLSTQERKAIEVESQELIDKAFQTAIDNNPNSGGEGV